MGKVFGNWCSFGPFSIFHQRAATPAGEKIEKSGVMEKAVDPGIFVFVFVF